MITEVEDYFAKGCGRCARFDTPDCAAQLWLEGLQQLRQLCLSAGLVETVKWGHPCYMHAERNIALIGAFRGDFRLSFFEAGLMRDPDSVLVKQGPNSAHAEAMVFRSAEEVKIQARVISAYLTEAKTYADAGKRAPQPKREIDLPDELIDALDMDPELAEAFHSLTPGRQRSYAINLNAAKQAQTRINRIAKLRPKILSGKGANEY